MGFWVVLLCWIIASLNFSCSPSYVVPCSLLNLSGRWEWHWWRQTDRKTERKTQDKSRYTEAEKWPPEVWRLNITCFGLSWLQQLTFHQVPFHILTFLIFNSKAHLLSVSLFPAKGRAVNIQPFVMYWVNCGFSQKSPECEGSLYVFVWMQFTLWFIHVIVSGPLLKCVLFKIAFWWNVTFPSLLFNSKPSGNLSVLNLRFPSLLSLWVSISYSNFWL